jgi:putative DNA primase/helicase
MLSTLVKSDLFCGRGDLTRRCLLSSLDAKVERPELREFSGDAIEDVVRRRRGELVVAGLTILRAWQLAQAAGERVRVPPFGGFDDWSQWVREPLIWLGEADPCETVDKARENDPQRDLLMAVILQWKENLNLNIRYTVQEVIARAVNTPSFHAALVAVAAAGSGGMIVSNERLGRWLKRVEGKIVGGFSLVRDGIAHGYRQWKLIQR